MNTPRISRANEAQVINAAWGSLTWYASAKQGNADDMTVGKCVIKPGHCNPKHLHPNCEEILVVEQGEIAHTTASDGAETVLHAGDTITIPRGFLHHARNVGKSDAVLAIAFSSANRKAQNE